jgi:HlyD family secretion protein
MNGRRNRWLLWGLLGVALVAGLVVAFRPREVPVDLVEVTRGPLVVTIDEEGETRVRDIFVLSSPVPGRSRRIEAEVGDRVVAGETVVAEIEPVDPSPLDVRSESEARAGVRAAEANLDLARSELERSEAELDFARSELERQRGLREEGATSERDLSAAERAYRTARAAVQTARAAIQARSFELDRERARLVSPTDGARKDAEAGDCPCIPLRAPVSGVVLRVQHESEGVVAAGQPLLDIGDPDDLEIIVDLLSADAVKVEPGQRVMIEEWGGDGPLAGVVRRVEPFGFTKVSALGIEEQRVNVLIDFTDPPDRWRRLGHGYRVEVRIVLAEVSDVPRVPLSALFRDGDGWAVFVDEDGRARTRRVERGLTDGRLVEVRAGLEAGTRVVRYPSDRVLDGVRIAQRRAG